MAGEYLFSVEGARAILLQAIGLPQAGLQERRDLQRWILDHPEVLGEGITIVTEEFGRWTDSAGAVERDRLDILALDSEGHPVVVELKRDKAPDTVDMQALKYAALVSRFTPTDLGAAHAAYLSQRQPGQVLTPQEALKRLAAQSAFDEQTLRAPRIILMASSFPRTVTATVVYLHQQLALDIKLLSFRAYRSGDQLLVTISQHYPPLEVEDFVLTPEVQRRRELVNNETTRTRDANSVARIVVGGLLEPGARLRFVPPTAALREQVDRWIGADPTRGCATWNGDAAQPLTWEHDGQQYSPTGLGQLILRDAANREGPIPGPNYWRTEDDVTLYVLARTDSEEPGPVERAAALTGELAEAFSALDEGLRSLTPTLERRSRLKNFAYYGARKLCDLNIHRDHLSLYILGMTDWHDRTATSDDIIVGGAADYSHLQVRDKPTAVRALAHARRIYERQNATAG